PADHALRAHPQLHPPRLRAHPRRWPHRPFGRRRAGAEHRGRGLRPDPQGAGSAGEGGGIMTATKPDARETVGEYRWGFHDDEAPLFIADKGLNEGVIRGLSKMKNEPAWMLENRLDAYRAFLELR